MLCILFLPLYFIVNLFLCFLPQWMRQIYSWISQISYSQFSCVARLVRLELGLYTRLPIWSRCSGLVGEAADYRRPIALTRHLSVGQLTTKKTPGSFYLPKISKGN